MLIRTQKSVFHFNTETMYGISKFTFLFSEQLLSYKAYYHNYMYKKQFFDYMYKWATKLW